jgi:hypothetical protein
MAHYSRTSSDPVAAPTRFAPVLGVEMASKRDGVSPGIARTFIGALGAYPWRRCWSSVGVGNGRARTLATCLALLGLGVLPLEVACASGAGDSEDRVRVLYPAGECDSHVIEIEVFDRASGKWQPHPEHWRVQAGTCQEEIAGLLLQELRYRCIDPELPSRNSEWVVGVDVFDPVAASKCEAAVGE